MLGPYSAGVFYAQSFVDDFICRRLLAIWFKQVRDLDGVVNMCCGIVTSTQSRSARLKIDASGHISIVLCMDETIGDEVP